jgi:HNH endonuclease
VRDLMAISEPHQEMPRYGADPLAWEERLEDILREDPSISETEREQLVMARRGQGQFKENVRLIERQCRITHVDKLEHLRASHIKPWRHAGPDERLDGENGFLLTPSIDHLFDRGFISFEDGGRLIISPSADHRSLQRMGVNTSEPVNVGSFSEGQRRYLDFHRDDVFLEARNRR